MASFCEITLQGSPPRPGYPLRSVLLSPTLILPTLMSLCPLLRFPLFNTPPSTSHHTPSCVTTTLYRQPSIGLCACVLSVSSLRDAVLMRVTNKPLSSDNYLVRFSREFPSKTRASSLTGSGQHVRRLYVHHHLLSRRGLYIRCYYA